jgi:thiol:disulfide interchange protein DsbC
MPIRQRLLLFLALLIPAMTAANEVAVKQAIQKKYPLLQVESVARTPITGIYEVFSGGEVFYVDEKVEYMFVRGRLIDVARATDLTEERLRVLTAVKFDQLPLDLAFRIVKGTGKRKVAYFTDPNCPYCKRLDRELEKVTNVTIHVFLYAVLSQDSYEKAAAVWCSKDRGKAYVEMMLNDVRPTNPGTCNTPLDKIIAYGRQQGIRGTPTLYFADGQRVAGAISITQLEKLLDSGR